MTGLRTTAGGSQQCRLNSATALYCAGEITLHDRNSPYSSNPAPNGAGSLNRVGILGWHVPALLRPPTRMAHAYRETRGRIELNDDIPLL